MQSWLNLPYISILHCRNPKIGLRVLSMMKPNFWHESLLHIIYFTIPSRKIEIDCKRCWKSLTLHSSCYDPSHTSSVYIKLVCAYVRVSPLNSSIDILPSSAQKQALTGLNSIFSQLLTSLSEAKLLILTNRHPKIY